MKLKISPDADVNYLASVVKIEEIKDHPNADRLSLVEVFGNTVIIAKGLYNVGDICIYFPVESCIAPKFLSWANLYDKAELNADGKTKGFFSSKGNRVKAVRLREIPSQGFLYKVTDLAKYYNTVVKDFSVGESFDTVGEDLLVTKYIRPERNSQSQNVSKNKIPKWVNSTMGVLPRPIRKVLFPPIKWYYGLSKDDGIKALIVDGQFKFHYKTENLGKNIWLVDPTDQITITSKMHGTSAIFGNILCKKNLTLTESILKLLGKNVPLIEYKEIYSSRSVLKNRRDGKYTDDLWGRHMNELSNKIPPGITLFCEIVGYASPGKCVQKGYDYGCAIGESECRVYRITGTTPEGMVTELSWDEIKIVCEELLINTVPHYYSGLAKDLFPDIQVGEDWSKNWLDALKDKFLDKTCEICKSGVVNEGIVVKINSRENKPVLKFKSPTFTINEGKMRDEEYEDIEELN